MSPMRTVGVRELKNKLSEYLREVRRGTVVLVTDRGAVVAELRQPELRAAPATTPGVLDRWIQQGKVRGPVSAKTQLEPTGVRLADGTSAALLDAERGE